MGIFNWKRKKVIEAKQEHIAETGSYIEVVDLKRQTAENYDKTTEEIERLNKLLRTDGGSITLKVHIATGGGRHGH